MLAFWLEDGNSRNGTFIEKEKLPIKRESACALALYFGSGGHGCVWTYRLHLMMARVLKFRVLSVE